MKDAMLHAIKNRRGHGLDLKIIVGGHDQMDKSKDLAPDAPIIDESTHDGPMHDDPMAKFLQEEKMEGEHDPKNLEALMSEEKAEEEPKHDDHEMLGHMGGHESMDHKPRSLAERAKMALMSKMGKK